MDPLQLLFYFLVIIPSAIIHEYSHGAVANMLGDPTAKYAGRLTLNPLAHIDPWGTVLMPLLIFFISQGSFLFAYAKPVPYNPYNLRYPRWGPPLVALAGPVSNLLLALICGLLVRLATAYSTSSLFLGASGFLAIIIYANIILAVFNLLPIPPLDGSKLLFALLPERAFQLQAFFERYGIIILLIFIFYAFHLISPIIQTLFRLIIGPTSFYPQ